MACRAIIELLAGCPSSYKLTLEVCLVRRSSLSHVQEQSSERKERKSNAEVRAIATALSSKDALSCIGVKTERYLTALQRL